MAGGAGVPYLMPHGVDGPGNRTLGCLNDLRKRWNGVVLRAATQAVVRFSPVWETIEAGGFSRPRPSPSRC